MSDAEENKAQFLQYFNDVWGGKYPEDDEWLGGIHAAFPDFKITPDKVLAAEDDHVVIMFTVTGTLQADYKNTPATGEPVTFRGATMARMENGRPIGEFAVAEKLCYDIGIFD